MKHVTAIHWGNRKWDFPFILEVELELQVVEQKCVTCSCKHSESLSHMHTHTHNNNNFSIHFINGSGWSTIYMFFPFFCSLSVCFYSSCFGMSCAMIAVSAYNPEGKQQTQTKVHKLYSLKYIVFRKDISCCDVMSSHVPSWQSVLDFSVDWNRELLNSSFHRC